jgi:hypothetical protein
LFGEGTKHKQPSISGTDNSPEGKGVNRLRVSRETYHHRRQERYSPERASQIGQKTTDVDLDREKQPAIWTGVVRVTSVDRRTTQSRIYIVNKKGGCERKGLVGGGWCKSVSETLAEQEKRVVVPILNHIEIIFSI